MVQFQPNDSQVNENEYKLMELNCLYNSSRKAEC